MTVAFDLCAMASDAAQLVLLQQIGKGTPSLQAIVVANDSRQQLIGALQILAFVGAAIAFLIWLYGAYRALVLLSAPSLRFTPGWAVGYWFVPFVNLVRPYQILKELWQQSSTKTSPAGEPAEATVAGIWWTTYLVSCAGGLSASGQSKTAKTIADLSTMTYTLAFANLFGVIAGVCAIRLVGGIQRFQEGMGWNAESAAPAAPPLSASSRPLNQAEEQPPERPARSGRPFFE